MRHGDAPAVVGERDVRVAERARTFCHGFDGGGAVGPVGVHVEVAPNVRQAQESRQLIALGERDLAAVLAQFRQNKSEAELVIISSSVAPAIRRLPANRPYSLSFQSRSMASPRSAILCAFDPVK